MLSWNKTNLLSYSSWGQKYNKELTKLKSRCWQGCVPSGGSWEEAVALPFPAFRGHLHSLAFVPFFFFLSSKLARLGLVLLMPPSSGFILLLSFTYKDPCDYTGSTWVTRIISLSQGQLMSSLNSICNLNSSLPCTLTKRQISRD